MRPVFVDMVCPSNDNNNEEDRRREEEKIRLAEKQKDEADCIALRLIAEQMASESNLSNSGKKTETDSSNSATTTSKMQSLLSFRTESSALTSMSQQTVSSNCKVEVSSMAILSQEDVGSSKEETDSSSTGEEIFYEATATASRATAARGLKLAWQAAEAT